MGVFQLWFLWMLLLYTVFYCSICTHWLLCHSLSATASIHWDFKLVAFFLYSKNVHLALFSTQVLAASFFPSHWLQKCIILLYERISIIVACQSWSKHFLECCAFVGVHWLSFLIPAGRVFWFSTCLVVSCILDIASIVKKPLGLDTMDNSMLFWDGVPLSGLRHKVLASCLWCYNLNMECVPQVPMLRVLSWWLLFWRWGLFGGSRLLSARLWRLF